MDSVDKKENTKVTESEKGNNEKNIAQTVKIFQRKA